jgi:hypothetical protein
MLRFIQSFFRKTPRPPAECTRIQGAELQVGMVVSLHDRPWLGHATGCIHSLNYHGSQNSKLLGDTRSVWLAVYLEISDGRDLELLRVYWNEDVWIYDD